MKKILLVLGSLMICGCSNEMQIKDNQNNLKEDPIAIMHNDYFIRDVNFKNIKNFELVLLHYRDNKLVEKEPLISDEGNKDFLKMDVLMAISLDSRNNKLYQASYLEKGVLGKFDFKFKDNDLDYIKEYYPQINLDNKHILLGGIYYSKELINTNRINDLCKNECLIYALEQR